MHIETDACDKDESAGNESAELSCEKEQTVMHASVMIKNVILITELIYFVRVLIIIRKQPECQHHGSP